MPAGQCRLGRRPSVRVILCRAIALPARARPLAPRLALTHFIATPTILCHLISANRSSGTRAVVGLRRALSMPRKYRIATLCTVGFTAVLALAVGGAYYAAQQVRPFYEQALKIEPAVVEEGSRELESRASALYSDAKQVGQWQALFTAQQINAWFAKQQAGDKKGELLAGLRDPRIAITRDCLTLGFRSTASGVETVFSVDASVLLTKDGAIGVRLMSVRAGALPLPVTKAADLLANATAKMKLPVRWTQQDGQPVAIVTIASPTIENRQFSIDSIELRSGEMYVAGHTENPTGDSASSKVASQRRTKAHNVALDEYELRLTPRDEHSALEIARRPSEAAEN